MSTVIRPELSKKNKYWISKHRFYELKHFCLQYDEFKSLYNDLSNGYIPNSMKFSLPGKAYGDPTANVGIKMAECKDDIQLIEDTCYETDSELYPYILKAVTQEYSYNYLKYVEDMPCSKDMFYDRYRKFFWLLSKRRSQKIHLS